MSQTNIDILQALLDGTHLDEFELNRAKDLIKVLDNEIKIRVL